MMDYDISRWLKNDLGLAHMSEADINCLMFHPRHGSLCRRLIKFLAESTLCSLRYSNVYAKEDCEEAMRELEEKNQQLGETMENLEIHVRKNANEIRELNFLTEKLDYLTKIDELQRASAEAFEAIASRPNFSLEQVGCNIEETHYLGNLDLERIYSMDDSLRTDTTITTRQTSSIEEDFTDLIGKCEVMHQATTEVLQAITKKMNSLDCDIDLKRTNVENLLAIKMPECEEEVLEADPEEKELKEQGRKMIEKICELDHQVTELSDQYKQKKLELNKRYKEQLEKDLQFLKKLQELESVVNNS